MSSNTLPLETQMLPPLVLRPPFGPRLLRALLMALAAILHVATAGWGLISNGREGDVAGAARHLLLRGEWLQPESPTGPLLLWLTKASMNAFGLEEFAVRLPSAIAVMVMVWFTMRIGEQLGGIWRGFSAGMILLCSPGMFSMARALTPAPLEAACIAAACYALVCGYLERDGQGRRARFAMAWLALSCAFFAGGWKTVAIPTGAVLWTAFFYPTARLRFRRLLSWEGGLIVALTAAASLAFGYSGLPVATPAVPITAAWRIAAWQAGLFFPWSLLLLPAIITLARRIASPLYQLEWEEAFPLAWIALGLGIAMAQPHGSLFDSVLVWPAIALWCALKLEVTPHRSLLWALGGVLLCALGGLVLAGMLKRVLTWFFPTMADFIYGIPPYLWSSIASTIFIAILAFVLFTTAALILELNQHRRFAMAACFAAMIPGAYAIADASAKFAPYFSYADIAQCINRSHVVPRTVLVDEGRFASTSLRFYLSPGTPIIEQKGRSGLSDPSAAESSFVVTRRSRLAQWEAVFPESTVICESGGSVLLATRPVPRPAPPLH